MAAADEADSLENLARAVVQLQETGSDLDLMQHIVDSAVASIEACTYASVSTDSSGRPNSPVVSDPAVLEIDALQYTIGVGPCLEAMRGDRAFIASEDLKHDDRFQPFGAEAARKNCRSVLAHRLYVDSTTLGSLNLYASEPHAFSEPARARSIVLSGLASLALNALQLGIYSEGLRIAVQSRDVIGQAKGVLMQRQGIDADTAFEELRTISQKSNVKLRDVAQRLVDEFAHRDGT